MVFNESIDLDPGLLKDFAMRAARSAASPDITESIRRLHLARVFQERAGTPQTVIEIGDALTSEIGLWHRASEESGAPFVRQAKRRHEWFSWADQDKLEPKLTKWRVALVGESVARGYIYDPHFNPASVLQQMLRLHLGTNEVDVVDLAKSNLMMPELKTLVGQCLALNPDVVVIFAGNNWRAQIADTDIPYVEALLREYGVPGLKSFIDARHTQDVVRLVSQMNSLLQPRNIKLIWVIPDFNLADWSDPVSPAPLLPGDGNKQWRRLNETAARVLSDGDFAAAENVAEEMVEIDGATNAMPLRILAQCSRAEGDASVTRRYLEMARDADAWNPAFSYSPRITSVTQKVLREAASLHHDSVIDLPEILGKHLKSSVPDRRMFLDYAHLTAEGINLAMAAVASKTIDLLVGKTISQEALQEKADLPPPTIEGKASLLAAVHNAHFNQSYEIVRYWCGRALEFWPESAEIMKRFIDSQTRRAPALACRSTIELFGLDRLGVLGYLTRGGKKRLDPVLGDAILHSLRERGIEIGPQLTKLRSKEHSIKTGPKELSDFYYNSVLSGRSQDSWTTRSFPNNYGSHAMYASAFSRTSNFVFFGEKGQPVHLKLTCRVPAPLAPDSVIAIDVNGHSVAQMPATGAWQNLEAIVPGQFILEGMNEVAIVWPEGDRESKVLLDKAADALVARRLPYFHEVFGEVHSLTARDPSWTPSAAHAVTHQAEMVSS